MIDFSLCLVTDRSQTRGRPLLAVIEQALQSGVDVVQLREKDLSARALFELAEELHVICYRYGARLLINDRIDVALAVDADGVHLPVSSFAVRDARQLLGSGKLIGASAHSVAEARTAVDGGADFIVFGPVFATPSKQPFGPPVGLPALRQASQAVMVPVFAIGGITADRVASVRQHGAVGVAVVSAILFADHPRTAAAALRAAL
jgi:thiamine-phosphate pyrophosphorylase